MIEILKSLGYEVLRKIGQGGMANVYVARDLKTNKEIAIKVLKPDNKDDIVTIKRFQNEIELMKRVNSPYVVKILDSRWDDKIQYIAMEYIPGKILKDLIREKVRLNVDEVIDIARQLTQGFDEIHRNKIVHRDIKSQNIMIGDHTQVKIIDFGIAITDESERLTKVNNIIGSAQYIAPELIKREKASEQSDIYALGILMYEMLTGEVPFHEKDAISTASKHVSGEIPQVHKLFPNVPVSLSNIIAKATQKNPNLRYKTMYEMFKDVDTCLEKNRLNEKPKNLGKKNHRNFIEIVNSSWGIIFGIGFFVVALIVALVVIGIKVF